ncbi:MAG: hypothetical protein E7397_00705 [Ruminococcaceae bacterium]|nr:hypothetical protein [Oscillospiraceae bacterium]
MKKKIILFLILILQVVSIKHQFNKFESRYPPDFVNKAQFASTFFEHKKLFDDFAKSVSKINNDIYFYYNFIRGEEQFSDFIEVPEAIETAKKLISEAGITTIHKTGDILLIYQYPDSNHDIHIGAKYNYTTKVWDYFYHHNYHTCRLCPTSKYRLYDLLYNRGGNLECE